MSIIFVSNINLNTGTVFKEGESGRFPPVSCFYDPEELLGEEEVDASLFVRLGPGFEPPAEIRAEYERIDDIVRELQTVPLFSASAGAHQFVGVGFGLAEKRDCPPNPILIDAVDVLQLQQDEEIPSIMLLGLETPITGIEPFPWINLGFYPHPKRTHEPKYILLRGYQPEEDSLYYRASTSDFAVGRIFIPNLPSTHYQRKLFVALTFQEADATQLTTRGREQLEDYFGLIKSNPHLNDGQIDRDFNWDRV